VSQTLIVFINMNHMLTDRTIKKRISEDGAAWVAQQQFWLFGTARYLNGSVIGRQEAERDARHYFNIIDKQILTRRDYNEGRRLQRLVFIEQGRLRANTHIHFYIKGTHLPQYRHIKVACEANWKTRIRKASDVLVQDNIELIHERKGYCWKEFDSLDSEVLYTPCCHLQAPQYT
jgi:hypothetical protein